MTLGLKQIAHTCIFARDIDETRRYYESVLGMRTVFNFTREGRIFGFYLDAGNRTFIEVFENTGAEYRGDNQINHICFEVTDIEAAVAHLEAEGAKATPARQACDDTFQAWTEDPNGIKIELFQYTDKSAQFAGGDREADW